jgi:hypothetical protein
MAKNYPRPYTVSSKEEGRGAARRARFRTLARASKYIQDRWQGADYVDGRDGFHTDYCTYTMTGFTFSDIGRYVTKGDDSYSWREFEFDADPVTPPTTPEEK